MTQHVVDHRRDAARVMEIDRYAVIGAMEHPQLDALVRLAALVCGAPTAFISIITATELHPLAQVGFDAFDIPREISMCDAVLESDEPLVSADLSLEPRFRDNPFVQQGRTIFYASYQLTTPAGVPFGSLCVFDDRPHELDGSQRRALKDIADRIVDMLELGLRNRELAATVEELERSNEQLAAFAGQVSHDLRNPLGAVAGALELLTDLAEATPPDVATMHRFLTKAHRSTARMATLLEEVLQFATLNGRLDEQPVDVSRLVNDVRVDLEIDLEGAAVEVGRLDDVVADPVQLRIVVQNLLSNAAKYTPAGQTPRIEVSAVVTDHTWRLEVVDHGRGIGEADRARVFEPFVRVSDSTLPSNYVDGTGMGLATCRRIISAHGGEIGLDPTAGGGTTAWVELPVDDL